MPIADFAYRTKTVADATAMTVRQVSYLATQGIVVPAVQPASLGSSALYAFRNVVELCVIARFREAVGVRDVPTSRLAPLIAALPDTQEAARWDELLLLSDPWRSWTVAAEEAGAALARTRAGTFVLSLALCETDARAGLRREGHKAPPQLHVEVA